MAVTLSPRLKLTRWSAGTDPFNRAQLSASLESLEANAAMFVQGTAATRPAFGVRGRFHHAEDTGQTSYDTGTAWVPVRPDLSGYVTTAQLGLAVDQLAAKNHTHDGAAITSGTVAPARLGTGDRAEGTFLAADGVWRIPAGAGTSPGATNLDGLTDVVVTSPVAKHVLRYDEAAGVWVNGQLGTADVSGLTTALGARNLQRVYWTSGAAPARPEGTTYVDWVGPTDPGALMQPGDTWKPTA